MIRYRLSCDGGHDFESWFPSSEAFDEQAARGFVSCPVCNSKDVGKALMAPAVSRSDRGEARVPVSAQETPGPDQTPARDAPTLNAEPERRLRALMRTLREQVTRDADHVGERFPEEARAIHYGDVAPRAIYGEADGDSVRALLEEGIAILPLPPAPDDRN